MTLPSVQPPSGVNTGNIHGAWQLLSYQVEVKTNGDYFTPMGDNPIGYVIFTPEGRLSFTLTAEGRQPAESMADRAAPQSSLIAYTGTYRLEKNRWITQVDVAWNPEWVGTEQTRFFSISDNQLLTVHTPWRVMPNWPERGLTRSIVRFKRCTRCFSWGS